MSNTDLLKRVGENFDVNFVMKGFPADKQFMICRTDLEQRDIDKKQKHKRRMLTEEKLDDIGARLEHTHRTSLKRLAQETGVSKSSARTPTQC
jgi:hypothetical protein